MAGFEFGNVGDLNDTITIICFLGVVVYILFFNVVAGVIEYFLEGSRLYHRMIQTIYKELMLMGLVSFTITMIEASTAKHVIESFEGQRWIDGVEFAHILLFFLTFFFVAHAFFLMRQSIVSRSFYRGVFQEKVKTMIESADEIRSSWFYDYLFNLNYLPLLSIKHRMELRLFHDLFRDTYWLPEDFNFADYLSGCLDQYALKTIDRSFITWFILIGVAVLNYGRIRLHVGFKSCRIDASAYSSGGAGGDTTTNSQQAGTHFLLTPQDQEVLVHRLLTSSSSSSSSDPSYNGVNTCDTNELKLFLLSAAGLCFFAYIMVCFARLYKLRMFQRIGVYCADDYIDFLKFSNQEEEKLKIARQLNLPEADSKHVTTEELKREIEYVLDQSEHSDVNSEFAIVAELLRAIGNCIKDAYIGLSLYTRS